MKLLNTILFGCLICGAIFIPGCSSHAEEDYPRTESNEVSNLNKKLKKITNQDLKPGKNVVSYDSEGEKIVAHIYLPKDYVKGQKKPAIVINPPATGVKEQTIGLYAEKLSRKGFITLALDPRGIFSTVKLQFLGSLNIR